MIPFPRYDATRETLDVWSVAAPFPAGSLEARRFQDMLAVASPVTGDLICAWIPFDQWTLPDGTALPDVDSAFAYLDGQCRQRQAVGTLTAIFPIHGVASFTARHGYDFAPCVTLTDASGAELDTDVVHAPGQVTVIFAEPFTGTLYVG